jgi:hypothetical protein
MQDDLDRALAKLAAIPTDARVEGLDAAVMARIASDAGDARRGARLGVAAAFGALAMGVIGSTTIAAPNPARGPALAPFGASVPLAPSTLLAGDR